MQFVEEGNLFLSKMAGGEGAIREKLVFWDHFWNDYLCNSYFILLLAREAFNESQSCGIYWDSTSYL
jgi:hypothetical protein